jgi:hypothetical protein
METSATADRYSARCDDLRSLVGEEGPFVSVYLTTEGAVDRARQRAQTEWKTIRAELASQGASNSVLDHIEREVPDAHRKGRGVAVVATEGGIRRVTHHDEPPRRDRGVYQEVPCLVELLQWRQSVVPHLVVRTDRAGADIEVVHPSVGVFELAAGGADDPLTRSAPGGWSQRRYQTRAEQTWERNADDVAAVVTSLADEHGAQLIAVAGDVRAVQLLRQSLPERVAALVEVVAGSRAADGSHDELPRDVHRRVATVTARDTHDVIEQWRQQAGEQARATSGTSPTVEALSQGSVELLLLTAEPDDEPALWFARDAAFVAPDEMTLRRAGVERPQRGPARDVMIRSALATGAGVRVIPHVAGGPDEGVGALLRWV